MLESAESWELPECTVERVTYPSDGLRLVGWIITPRNRGSGPFPVLVWNHGARFATGDVDLSLTPSWQPGDGCLAEWRADDWLMFMPECRGYAGSEGPRLVEARARGLPAVLAFLHDRARDVNAGVELLHSRPNVRADRVAITGISHGGVAAILAAATGSYCAVAAQATGASAVDPSLGIDDLKRAISRITAPILLQHVANDQHIPADVSRQLAQHARATNARLTYREYPGIAGLDGHLLFSEPSCRSIWQPDYFAHLTEALVHHQATFK
jgi:dienelactone hydrolase